MEPRLPCLRSIASAPAPGGATPTASKSCALPATEGRATEMTPTSAEGSGFVVLRPSVSAAGQHRDIGAVSCCLIAGDSKQVLVKFVEPRRRLLKSGVISVR